ncbi:MAG TPA: Gfo/Idh/MocA family oxidoreductase [Gemmatimonadaceae bacterium]|nr:Gfo/Idh/MocA family oxidoreductase [Gemmatimonadaceae bacterium]
MANSRLGVGFIGSGFNTRFHMQGWRGIREADALGVWSPNAEHAASTARLARELNIGACKPYKTIAQMVADPAIDAIWLCGANHARIENMEEIVDALDRGRASLVGIASEKPLARNVAEALKVQKLADKAELKTGYLENQVFAPAVETGKNLLWARGASTTGRPYLARAAEEHSGPHSPWFWQGALQGGGVLNDMMCHSALVVRHLLTKPGQPLRTVKPKRVTGHIASLKWTRPEYVARLKKGMGSAVDYAKAPSEDFASIHIEFETDDGHRAIGEATTSWSYVGAGLRLSAELLGPEYAMQWNSLDSGLQLFFSREVRGKAGEDLVEKQNAETGGMPVVPEEAAAYGYTDEDRHFVRVFLGQAEPRLTFADGVDVVRMLMTAYQSAELGRTLDFPPKGIDKFVPQVAQGKWRP